MTMSWFWNVVRWCDLVIQRSRFAWNVFMCRLSPGSARYYVLIWSVIKLTRGVRFGVSSVFTLACESSLLINYCSLSGHVPMQHAVSELAGRQHKHSF